MMEVFLGMIMFLQVFVSIQIMLAHRQTLQRLKKMENSIKETLEKDITIIKKEEKNPDLDRDVKSSENIFSLEQEKKENECEQSEKELPENLISEVLSEVFS